MDPATLTGELREQLRARPYVTVAGIAGVGWMLGRRWPLRALLALAAVGARVVVTTALEGAVRERLWPGQTLGLRGASEERRPRGFGTSRGGSGVRIG